jgi:hypothetical protein
MARTGSAWHVYVTLSPGFHYSALHLGGVSWYLCKRTQNPNKCELEAQCKHAVVLGWNPSRCFKLRLYRQSDLDGLQLEFVWSRVW